MMGALATFVPWSPEDDLLLKNAVEAGASLESLAKGAVQFSRRYSIREIQDRWYSILYDPIISTEAATGMTNFELSTSPLPSKFYKFGHSKEHKIVSVKRKTESVRTSYYAMRKRICNNTITSMDLTFVVDPENDNYLMNESEPLLEYCMPDGATSNHFENLDVVHYDFPENTMDRSVATNGVASCTFYNGIEDPVEDSFRTEQTTAVKEEPQILRDNGSLNGAVEKLGVPKELAIDSLIGDDNFETMPLSTFGHIINDPGNSCSKFDGNHVFDSPELECGTSFDALQLSPLPQMPMWATDVTFQEPIMPCDDFKDSITCGDDYLAELSNSLLNFTNEEEFYLMDVDEKDRIDKSYYDGLNSLLLNSPNDVPDQIPRKAETESLVVSHPHVSNLSVSCHIEVDDKTGLHSSDAQVAHRLQSQMPSSASVKDPRFPERINGVICCRLSTEDPEVPSNDDVFLPFDAPPSTFSSASKWTSKESNKPTPSPVMDCGFSNSRASETGKILKQVEQSNPRESLASSQNMGSPPLPMSFVVSKVKCELPNSHVSHTVARSAVTFSGSAGVNNSVNTTNALMHENPKGKATNVGLAKHQSNHVTNSFNEKPGHDSNDFRNHPQPSSSIINQELAVALPIQDHQLQHAEVGPLNALQSDLVANPPTFDDEEQYCESDDDVPYFSDIEEMILDMDLDPDDQDLYYNEEVSRYHNAETKRTIIRLEQGAHSHMQRAIASHGAFAILYGRRSKHYIKKAEVVLGRATESVPVDIDLGKEGHANIISRRQAVIKMDKDGFFYIKNFGKGLILVNNKEVHTGQSQRLHSNCLVELRGLPFIFETNQSRVMEYLDQHITDNSQTC
ncbi:putative transcription factor interactor and regulator FHA-SMAD family [Lupinus albus]|uniref:Putative transcription factor interactor and regulator FHA-SMAD family n=1 Tax=Lupinus albus TaxID=3870 RepID=A0A6A4PPX9_LUPAL|nr:putative transcription factor interactor and regulator FHA-SMAD family [Lupinus albus]